MTKFFNVTGTCRPNRHYMVNLESRLKEIKAMVDKGLGAVFYHQSCKAIWQNNDIAGVIGLPEK